MSSENGLNTYLREIVMREKSKIEEALEVVHRERAEEYETCKLPLEFNRERLALSEMQLCRAVYEQGIRELFEKLGYRAVMGFAQVYDNEGTLQRSRYHCFYYNQRHSSVVCLTAGQLLCNGGVPSHKGEAIEKLQSDAPRQVIQLSTEVVVLYGTVDDLERELRFKYIPIWGKNEE